MQNNEIGVRPKASPAQEGHKKELECRKNANDKKKDVKETIYDDTNSSKGKEKTNLVSNVITEELSDAKTNVCATLSSNNASTTHLQDMQITKCDIIDALNQTSQSFGSCAFQYLQNWVLSILFLLLGIVRGELGFIC